MAVSLETPRSIKFFGVLFFVDIMFYVYINHSITFDKYYIGQTQDFNKRIDLHNNGLVKSTKPYIPWINVCLTPQ